MLFEGSSDIIEQHSSITLPNGDNADMLVLFNGLTLVIYGQGMAMYRTSDSVTDPLGNGLIDQVDLLNEKAFESSDEGYVKEYTAGYVGLVDQRALLITPNYIQLYPNKEAALRNKDEIARLKLG